MADNLTHAYDAIKRREYYLKTRQLKGHNPGSAKASTTQRKGAVKPAPKSRAMRQAERRKQIEAQVAALKGRLEKLRTVLAEETKKAQARSGQKSKQASGKKSKDKTPKQTARQKADAAKRSKEYREKNKDQLLADEVKSLTKKIKTIQERIAKMRKNGSVGARRTTAK